VSTENPKPVKPEPKIHIIASLDLLAELHEAYEYFQRARIRSRQPPVAPHLESLMVQMHQARAKAQARGEMPKEPPSADAPG
jgi:hypothetical protein